MTHTGRAKQGHHPRMKLRIPHFPGPEDSILSPVTVDDD